MLRICSYNILAQTLATSSFFPYAGNHLKKAKRIPLILERISGLRADVICISEAFPEVCQSLEATGYGVIFKPRAGRPYGVALAFKKSSVECLGSASLDFDDAALAIECGAAAEGPPQAAEVFRTSSLALFASMRLKEEGEGGGGGGGGAGAGTGKPFLVGATHLFWGPRLECVKACQAVALKLAFADFASKFGSAHTPLFLGGDFNSMPGSWVCRVLEDHPFPASSGDVAEWDVLSREPKDRDAEQVKAWCARLQQQLKAELGLPIPTKQSLEVAPGEGPRLTSLYTVGRSECEITTYTHTFQACIDYVYALGKVSPSGLTHIPVPTKAELGGPIPSAMEPSDHLPLGVEIPL